jgi:hypothetical protein
MKIGKLHYLTGLQYGEDLKCEWLITSVDGLQIEADFTPPFHLEVVHTLLGSPELVFMNKNENPLC